MKYEECYQMIINRIKETIITEDKMLQIKIFNNLLAWYKRTFSSLLKTYCKEDNQLAIIQVFKQIEKVLELDDYSKLKLVTSSSAFEEFLSLSDNILSLVKRFSQEGKLVFKDEEYDSYLKELGAYESRIPVVLLDEYRRIYSECLLDLQYLKNDGKVSSYSYRTYDYLKSIKTDK